MDAQVEQDDFGSAFDEFAEAGDASPVGSEAPQGDNSRGDGEAPDAGEDSREEAPEIGESGEADADGDAPEGSSDPVDPVADLQAQIEDLRHKHSSEQGRQAAMQRKVRERDEEIARLRAELEQRQQAGDDLGEEAPAGSGVTSAEWERLKEDMPDVARAMEQLADAKLAEIRQSYEKRIQPFEETAQQNAIAAEYAYLTERHPDWQDIRNDPDFAEWYTSQPPAVQEYGQSDHAHEVAWLLDTYKTHRAARGQAQDGAQLQERRRRQMEGAQTVPGRQGGSRAGVPNDGTFEDHFNFFADKR